MKLVCVCMCEYVCECFFYRCVCVCVFQIKCAQYWPAREEREAVFEDTHFKLTLVSEDIKSYFTVRQLELENLEVRHTHAQARIQTHKYLNTSIHTHTLTYIHTYTRTHSHACTHLENLVKSQKLKSALLI